MKILKLIITRLFVTLLVYCVLAVVLFVGVGVHPSPWVQRERLSTDGLEKSATCIHDYPNNIFSAKDYIKQSFDYLWDKAGLNLYIVSMYVPEDVDSQEEMIAIIQEEIDTYISHDNGIYVCCATYKEGDTRESGFVCNHILYGKNAKKYCDIFFKRTFEMYYKFYLQDMIDGEFLTASDCAALALKDTVAASQGFQVVMTPLAGVCIIAWLLSCITGIMSTRKTRMEYKGNSSLYLRETDDKREYN